MSLSGPRSAFISFPVVTGWMPNSRSATSNANWLFLAQSASFKESKSLEKGVKRCRRNDRRKINKQINWEKTEVKTLSGLVAIPLHWEPVFAQSVSLVMHNICRKPSRRTVWWLDELIYNQSHLTDTFSFMSKRDGRIYDRKCENYDVIVYVNHDANSRVRATFSCDQLRLLYFNTSILWSHWTTFTKLQAKWSWNSNAIIL